MHCARTSGVSTQLAEGIVRHRGRTVVGAYREDPQAETGTLRWHLDEGVSGCEASDLVSEHVKMADVGWRGKELIGFLGKGLPNRTAKMALACRLVREGVDDAELRWAEPDREPWFRAGFPLDQRQRREKKFLDRAFLARLGLEPNE